MTLGLERLERLAPQSVTTGENVIFGPLEALLNSIETYKAALDGAEAKEESTLRIFRLDR